MDRKCDLDPLDILLDEVVADLKMRKGEVLKWMSGRPTWCRTFGRNLDYRKCQSVRTLRRRGTNTVTAPQIVQGPAMTLVCAVTVIVQCQVSVSLR